VVTLLSVTFVAFRIVHEMDRLRPQPAAAPATKACPYGNIASPVKVRRCPHGTSALRTIQEALPC